LVTDPQVIIIDEPTSGIDSFNSLVVMNYLKELANEGKLISKNIFNLNNNKYVHWINQALYTFI